VLAFGESFAAWIISTVAATFGGLVAALFVGRYLRSSYLLAFSLGVILWVFTDVIDDAGKIDIEASFSGGWEQLAIIVLFAASVLTLFYADRSAFSTAVAKAGGIATPVLLAIAIGAHGLGEGLAFGAVSATTPFSTLITAFGGEAAGASYVMHKFLEALAVGSFYLLCVGPKTKSLTAHLRNMVTLTVAFTLPSLAAMAVGYYYQFNAVYFFSIGTGALLYAIVKLAGPISSDDNLGSVSFKTGLWLVVGFLCTYFAALFHSYVP
jgi:hypothetical protein